MGRHSEVFVAFDVAEKKHCGDRGRAGPAKSNFRQYREQSMPIARTIKRLAEQYDQLHVCFEAGPMGYGLYRQVQALGHDYMIVSPDLIPKRSGERVKTNRLNAS